MNRQILRSTIQGASRYLIVFGLVTCSTLTAIAGGIVTILPVQVCDNDGNNCANAAKTLFEAETDKIWAQVGIDVNFLAWDTWKSTDNLTIVNGPPTSPAAFFAAAPAHSLKAANPNSITMWFIKSMNDGTYGEANAIGGDKIVIMDNVFATSRRDTIAHEIGHSLGLKHDDPGMDTTYLMWSGTRQIPDGLDNITPDGLKLDKLTAAQITTAGGSAFVVIPEPATAILLVYGLCLLAMQRKTR